MLARSAHNAMQSAATLSSTAVGPLSSRSTGARRLTPARSVAVPARGGSVVVRAGIFDKMKEGKSMSAPNPKGQNLIKPKRMYEKGEEPWWIDPETGKAPPYLQVTVFMASQLFVGLVMQPFAVWYGNLFAPYIK